MDNVLEQNQQQRNLQSKISNNGGKMTQRKIHAKRSLVCRGHGRKRFCVYLHRNRKGQITKVTNVGRSIRRDTAVRAKRRLFRPRHSGLGHTGDF